MKRDFAQSSGIIAHNKFNVSLLALILTVVMLASIVIESGFICTIFTCKQMKTNAAVYRDEMTDTLIMWSDVFTDCKVELHFLSFLPHWQLFTSNT